MHKTKGYKQSSVYRVELIRIKKEIKVYRITCCRGKENNNRRCKGTFIKEFDTLSSFVNFFMKSYSSLFFPHITMELTQKELNIVCKKIKALNAKYSFY